MTYPKYHRAAGRTPAILLAALILLPGATGYAQATNTVTGTAFGTDYSALATAASIASQSDGAGALVVGFAGTTNITLSHAISGFIAVTNGTDDVVVDAAGATVTGPQGVAAVFTALGTTNLNLAGGRFIAGAGLSGGGPPLPGGSLDAAGGWAKNGTLTVNGSTFAGTNYTAGFIVQQAGLTASNAVFRGGTYGAGLYVTDDSTITLYGGSVTGGLGNTAVFLGDSSAEIHDGTFVGNIGGPANVVGTGLFSELTTASTNRLDLYGGTFSSVALYGVDGSVQRLLAGTNLVVQGALIQNGGTVIVDHRTGSSLTDISVFSGTMSFTGDSFSLADGRTFLLSGPESRAGFQGLRLESGSTMDIGTGHLSALDFYAASLSTNLLSITDTTNGTIRTDRAWFDNGAVLIIDAAGAGMSSSVTNGYSLIAAGTNRLFAGSSTNTAATAQDFKDNVTVETSTSDRARFVDLFFEPVGDETRIRFLFTAEALSDYWDLTNGTSTVITETFANELDQLAGSEMLSLIDGFGSADASLAAVEQTYFSRINTFRTALDGAQAAVGQSMSRGAEFRESSRLRPSGPRGPQHGSTLRGWAKYYGQRLEQDPAGLNPAYDTSLDGGVIGVDMSFGSLLAGVSGGWGTYDSSSGTGANEEISAYHGSLYTTLGMDSAYLDAGVGYGFNQVETRTRNPFVLNGEFDAQIISAYFGGGMDFVDSTEGMVFTPEAYIQYALYEQDAYAETGTAAVPRRFDAFDADSLRSSVGINVSIDQPVSMETFSFKYDVRLHWIREYNPDPGAMRFGLDGGSESYTLTYPSFDEDVYRAGVGAVFSNTKRTQPKNVLFRIDFDEIFGESFSSHNFSAKVIYAF